MILWARDGCDGLRRLLFEKIAELIFAKLRRAWDQINARELIVLGALACVEQYERAVGTPRDRVAVCVRNEADGPARAAINGRDEDVSELLDGHVSEPTTIGRPDERTIRDERLPLKRRGRNHALLFCAHLKHAQLFRAALEGDPFAVGREQRLGIVGRVAR